MQVEYLTQCLECIAHLLRRDNFNNKLDEAIYDGDEDESIYDDKLDEDCVEDIGTQIWVEYEDDDATHYQIFDKSQKNSFDEYPVCEEIQTVNNE